jgi:hypothetical protein
VGKSVATEEILETNHVARGGGPDEQRASFREFDQRESPNDEGAHDALANLGFLDDESPQLLGGDEQGFDFSFCVSVGERYGLIAERTELRDELTWPLLDDRRGTVETIAQSHRNTARENHKHPRSRISRQEEWLAIAESPHGSAAPNALDLGFGECRKRFLEAAM